MIYIKNTPGFLFFKNKVFICVAIPLLLLTASCTNNKSKINITAKQIANIKENFTSEEIIYFYETVFFIDPEARDYKPFIRNTKVKKWNKDIYIKIFGNKTNKNLKELTDVTAYLNSLKLPFTIYLTEKDDYNISFYFGDKYFFEKETGRKLIECFSENSGFGNNL